MKSLFNFLLLLLAATFTLSSCEQEETNFRVTPKTQIIFFDNIDVNTADFQKANNLNLKVTANGASSVRVTSLYNVGVAARTKDVGTFSVSGGSAIVTAPSVAVRNTADGDIPGFSTVAPVSSRAANTYTLKVDAIFADGSVETRFLAAVIIR
ncbi:hypothetical protein GCM10022408_31940 [Hymenobacter fastidiosus]|uniref:DUF4625 domain-containing protein n=1 Tax=Hymenobacter fastidiosus TaxID=486264 RepID=A0ABP7SU74_9BACT